MAVWSMLLKFRRMVPNIDTVYIPKYKNLEKYGCYAYITTSTLETQANSD